MTINKTSESEKNCLFLISEKGKWGINEHLKPLKAVYNGAGWFIEEKHRSIIEKISREASMRYIEFPLNGETFDSLRIRHKRDFLHEKAIKTRFLIDDLKSTLGISNLGIEEFIQGERRTELEQIQEGKQLIEYAQEYEHLQEQIQRSKEEEMIANISIKNNLLPIVKIKERIDSHKETLKKYRGKKYLGLRVKTITEFNDNMLGLRKLILLAAAPNVGKTALTIQLAMDVLLTEPDACLVYVSLEMSAEEIFTRMNLHLSELNFDTYVLGSQQAEEGNNYHHFFSQEELRKIDSGHKEIEKIGNRLQIIDESSCSNLDANTIINYVENLKRETGCQRAIIVIDYLQVWPIPSTLRLTSDTEADKWRIGQIKKIRDALNQINQDPVIVISEARKPSPNADTWGSDLSDVMGSARGTYTPDAVLLLSQLSDKELEDLWKKESLPIITNKRGESGGSVIREHLANQGVAISFLKMPKGRDGMKRFSTLLTFYFHKNKFEKLNLLNLRLEPSEDIYGDKLSKSFHRGNSIKKKGTNET
jgi:hypothetical protein